jgi:hypothetical protein
MIKLLEYITIMPDENADNNRGHRFPFVASEILSCDAPVVLDMFFMEQIDDLNLPEDSEQPVLLTLKFKKEFLQSRREKKQNEDSGMVADSDDYVQADLDYDVIITHDEEETKQGTEGTLGNNNAEALETNPEVEEKSADPPVDSIIEQSNTSNDEKVIENVEPENSKIEVQDEFKDEVIEAVAPDAQNTPEVEPAAVETEVQTGSDSVSITTTDTEPILLELAEEKYSGKYALLDMLFDFILSAPKNIEINPVLSGYFEKVVLALLGYNQKQVMNYIYTKENVMEKLIDHVYDKSICDVIIKVLNISNTTSTTTNTSINNDSGEIFESPSKMQSQKDDSMNFKLNYEASRNEIIHKLIDKLIRAKNVEEYWNSSSILCEMAKFKELFEFLSSPEILDKISIGLENDDEEGIKHTLKLYNVVLREYCKDGTNKRVNISALQEDDENEQDNDDLGLKLDEPEQDELVPKERNNSTDKSGDQSGSNLSKSAITKENEVKEKLFISNISTIIPLIVQLIKDEVNAKYIETTYQVKIRAFGGMKLEAVEMISMI